MVRKRQILVIGNNDNGCTPEVEKLAYDMGSKIAKSNSVLITGGLGGVMRAASRGAHDTGGLTVGIIPQNDFSLANEFCDIVIPTGIGLMRDFLNALSADGVIVIGGGSGTLSEICAAYMYKKPIIALKNSGGSADYSSASSSRSSGGSCCCRGSCVAGRSARTTSTASKCS